jgi:hypothetical protein
MGPAPMIRMVEISVLLGIDLTDWILGTKKGRAAARPLSQERGFPSRAGWSLDQIPHPRNPQKAPINRDLVVI